MVERRLSRRGRARAAQRFNIQDSATPVSQSQSEQQFRDEQISSIDTRIERLRSAIASKEKARIEAFNRSQGDRISSLEDRIALEKQEINTLIEQRRRIQRGENLTSQQVIEFAKEEKRVTEQREINRKERLIAERQARARAAAQERAARKLEGRGFRQARSGAIINVRQNVKVFSGKREVPTVESIQGGAKQRLEQFQEKPKPKKKAATAPMVAAPLLAPPKGFLGRVKEKVVSSELFRSLPTKVQRTGDPIFKIDFQDPEKSQLNLGFRAVSEKQLEREARARQLARDRSFLRKRTKQAEKVFTEFESTKIVPAGIEAKGFKVSTQETTTAGVTTTTTTISDPVLETRAAEVERRVERARADESLNTGFFSGLDKAISTRTKERRKQTVERLAKTPAGQSLLLLETFGTRRARAEFVLTSKFTIDPLEKQLSKAQLTGSVIEQGEDSKRKKPRKATTQPVRFIEDPVGNISTRVTNRFRERPSSLRAAVARSISSKALSARENVLLPRAFKQEFEEKPVSRGALIAGVTIFTAGTTFLGSTATGIRFTQSTAGQFIGSTAGIGVTGLFVGSRLKTIADSPRGRPRTRAVAKSSADVASIGIGIGAGAALGKFAIAKFEEAKLRFVLRKQELALETLTSATEGGHPSTSSVSRIPKEFRTSKFKLPKEAQRLQARRGFHATTGEPRYEGTRVRVLKDRIITEKIFSINPEKSTLPTGEPRGFFVSNQISTGRFGGGSSITSSVTNPNIFGVGGKQIAFRVTGEKNFVSPPFRSQVDKVRFIEQQAPRGQGIFPLQKTEIEAVFPPTIKGTETTIGRPALVAVRDSTSFTKFGGRPVDIKLANVLSERESLRLAGQLGIAQAQGGSITINPTAGVSETITASPISSSLSQPSSSNVGLLFGFSSTPSSATISSSIPSRFSSSVTSSSAVSSLPSSGFSSSRISSSGFSSSRGSSSGSSSSFPSSPVSSSVPSSSPVSSSVSISPPFSSPVTTSPPPAVLGGMGDVGFKSQFKSLRGPKGFVPSLVSILGNIRGRVNTKATFSGFEIRPIPNGRKKRKRRKK